ncbi:Osmotin, thaumatin-like protein [Eremomyces bilateralis CBS 781.70]|uniref:Osmotin, thaumatin-like protein n=1 Tax=Eremomyces bilateralis CBS 781.70 TaxID=1392243 RepID=A0A6G1FUZ8_9PEZI|nr:Osmotin, thaumatin-like protein [Eremomyces bilateralis CBS 781.70]KAF1809502.1 Osmotin, thaumatin-like protein [Eremomyces bilateralis CBS 781.70]
MNRIPPYDPLPRIRGRQEKEERIPITITNNCKETIWPGIVTQAGKGPKSHGFELKPGESRDQTLDKHWQGRIWMRTNCTFNQGGTGPENNQTGKACGTGDCNGLLDCKATGDLPVTLAEFTLDAGDGNTYYDISLVDGYNIPLAIIRQQAPGNTGIDDIPPNLTNPSCIATSSHLAPQDFSPYADDTTNPHEESRFLGTNSTSPLPFDRSLPPSSLLHWCPWDCQLHPPPKPGADIYPYPDDAIPRPVFQPCLSACAKWNRPEDCCAGKFATPEKCAPGLYSRNAKRVCPDAYSYAFDDGQATFVVPGGGGWGWEVVACHGGRSTTILRSALAGTGDGGQVALGGRRAKRDGGLGPVGVHVGEVWKRRGGLEGRARGESRAGGGEGE